ncbi:MAG: SO_0444 family Cu/Zn efflux transporter [Chitinophagales bacterium]
MNFVTDFFNNLWQLTIEMAPWLLLGFFFAGLQKAFFPQQKVQQYIGENDWKSVLKATLMGIPLPLCSCGVIPTGISLHKNGASKGATNGFFIATPQTGVDSIFATYALLGLPFAIIRPIIALITGFFGGILTNFTTKDELAETNKITDVDCQDDCCDTPVKKSKLKTIFRYGFITMVEDLAKWLVIGLVLAALITTLIPDNFFQEYIGNQWIELLIVLAISIPLYVCATGSIPIAASLLLKGISPGAALLFLMAGPATNIATITVLAKTMGKRSMLTYLFAITFGALFFAILVNYFLPTEWFLSGITEHVGHEHSMFPKTVENILAYCLVALIVWALYTKYINPKKTVSIKKSTTIKVKGMTCNHCKVSIEQGFLKLGAKNIDIDLKTGLVQYGAEIPFQKVYDTITGLGFEIEDIPKESSKASLKINISK